MSSPARRVFLDWSSPCVPRAARWLLDEHGPALGDVVVALPGRRAARALTAQLARLAGPALVPPRVLTQGALVDELVRLDRPVAGRLARTLAWARALRELGDEDPAALSALVAQPPANAREGFALAEVVRALHGELAPEGLSFADVARLEELRSFEGEARRWAALTAVQARWHARLDAAGVADPHEGRRAAIEAGEFDRSRAVVLVGVADMNRLLRRLVQELGGAVSVLIAAPEELAAGFDELGALAVDFWKERDLPLPLERWRVADRPQEQAAAALRALAGWNGRFAAHEIALGVADDEVVPALERALAEQGVLARPAAGTRLDATAPVRLLAGVAEFLARPDFAGFAALARQSDFERALERACAAAGSAGSPAGETPAALLDRYHVEHLPRGLPAPWLEDELAALEQAARAVLGRLWSVDAGSAERRALAAWAPPVREFLTRVYGEHGDVDADAEGQRVVAAALEGVETALEELEALPAALAAEPRGAAEALELLLAAVAGAAVPPRPPAPGEAALELLGWLDLPLDEAPALVVTGFNGGRVPLAPARDPFLPEALRARLGLPGDEARLARDVYAASALCAARRELVFVSGRRSRAGDPLLPSRLVFHRPASELPARVQHFYAAPLAPLAAGAARLAAGRDERPRALPRRAGVEPPRKLRVTAFADYLRSPYLFYLRHVLQLETLDDEAVELDARAFGILAHDVLADFGRDAGVRDADDARPIAEFLVGRLRQRARGRFGPAAEPAVELQLIGLARRLESFAVAQAERRALGWRIHAVEWSPERPVQLAGRKGAALELRGRIDRIDVREGPASPGGREWAILDYKTGEKLADPGPAHRARDGTWRDLQLPLYTLLARELGLESARELGYFGLGATPGEVGVRSVDWTPADLAAGLDAAREVVDRVLAGDFFEEGSDFRAEPAFEAILGRNLLVAPPSGLAGEEDPA